MCAPVLRTLVPGRRPVGPHVHGECWPTGGSRPGQRAPPHAEPCRRRVDRARWSLAIVDPRRAGVTLPLAAEVESDRIPDLFVDIEQAAEATHLAYRAVRGQVERPSASSRCRV